MFELAAAGSATAVLSAGGLGTLRHQHRRLVQRGAGLCGARDTQGGDHGRDRESAAQRAPGFKRHS
jgi:hypothetical protein